MQKTNLVSGTAETLTLHEIQDLIQGWIDDGELRQLSPRTLDERRGLTAKLVWFLQQREYATCGTAQLRAFLAYVAKGHEQEGGRWGNPNCNRAAKPRTVAAYYRVMRSLFRWGVEAGEISASPLAGLKPPMVRADQVQPFTEEQVNKLLAAARASLDPRRNEVLILFMLDTGARASEVVEVKLDDVDLTNRKARLHGKGNKERSVYLGRQTTRALWAYLREQPRPGTQALFTSKRGERVDESLTRGGLAHIIRRLGAEAKLEAVRCSPHTIRHTCAITFLRAGGNVFALQTLLGHTDLSMTRRYVAYAEADMEAQHRQFSPADRLKKR